MLNIVVQCTYFYIQSIFYGYTIILLYACFNLGCTEQQQLHYLLYTNWNWTSPSLQNVPESEYQTKNKKSEKTIPKSPEVMAMALGDI